jgi:prepilin-type N-terminal cleavage/methylation domain-containing protein
MLINQKIKAFTLIELLVSMALTAILVVFAFMGYNHMQKLFMDYRKQSQFISDYNRLNKAVFLISGRAKTIEKTDDQHLIFKTDSNSIELEMTIKTILLKFESHTDTFNLEIKEPKFDFLKSGDGNPSILIKKFECLVLFQSQKFHVSFHKEYDAASTLNSTLVLLPPDEQY